MKKSLGAVVILAVVGVLIGVVIIPAIAQGGGKAQIPNTIGYQGYLTDSGGTSIEDPVDITFTLYTELAGGTPVWAETHSSVDPDNGLFSVALGGNGSPIYTNMLDGDRYLGVKVGADAEMTPRQKLASVAYALRADVANTAFALDAPDGDPQNAVYVDNDGKVGIGTGTPTAELEVDGTVKATEFVGDGSGLDGLYTQSEVDALLAALETRILFKVKSWGTAELIETDNAGDAWHPQVAVDSSGNAVAVWYQLDGTRYNIWANRYVAGTGWGTAELIESGTGSAYRPQVAVDSSGNAVAVWYQWDGTRNNIYSNRYVAGTGWGTAQLIETDNAGSAWHPQVAVDSSGNAVAVWYQVAGGLSNIWANRYVAGTGWGTEEIIGTYYYDDVLYSPLVAVDSSGNTVAVWEQDDGTRNNIYANRYVAGTGWGTAQLIETDNAGDAQYPQVAVDSSGNAVAVWYQFDGTRWNIYSNRYVAGTSWGTAEPIEDNAGDAGIPQVAVDSSGNAVAVWVQFDGARYNIRANRYVAGTGWGTAEPIEDNAGDAFYPQVSVDSSGNAVAVWVQFDGTRDNIWSNRYVAGTGWGTAELIETDNAGDASYPQVSIDSSGNAVAVWYQSDGIRDNIWANRCGL